MANMEKIEAVLGVITKENLDMGQWAERSADAVGASCGTTLCFAGHAVVQDGYELRWEAEYDEGYDDATGAWEDRVIGYVAYETTDGRSIEHLARNILDLTPDESHAIFYSTGIGKDVDKLREHVHAVLSGETHENIRY